MYTHISVKPGVAKHFLIEIAFGISQVVRTSGLVIVGEDVGTLEFIGQARIRIVASIGAEFSSTNAFAFVADGRANVRTRSGVSNVGCRFRKTFGEETSGAVVDAAFDGSGFASVDRTLVGRRAFIVRIDSDALPADETLR